jgi:hypothetical protein
MEVRGKKERAFTIFGKRIILFLSEKENDREHHDGSSPAHKTGADLHF